MTAFVPPRTLRPGGVLAREDGSYLLSVDNGKATLRRADRSVAWESEGDGGSRLEWQTDGNLVLYADDGRVIWTTGTGERYVEDCRLELRDDGRLAVVIFGRMRWQSPPALPAPAAGISRPDRLTAGGNMRPGDHLQSPDGRFRLEVDQIDGLVVFFHGEAIWKMGIGDPKLSTLEMQSDGNLVLYAAPARPLWASDSAGARKNRVSSEVYLVIDNDGEVSLRDSVGALWSAGSAPKPGRATPGQTLAKGQSLQSRNGKYTLKLQDDGNLVLSGAAGQAVWMTGLVTPAAHRLVLSPAGHLELVDAAGGLIWRASGEATEPQRNSDEPDYEVGDVLTRPGASINFGHKGSVLDVGDDGILRLINPGGETIWESGSYGSNRLNPGQGLAPGMWIADAVTGRLVMQHDGDLVFYDLRNQRCWHSGTEGKRVRGFVVGYRGAAMVVGEDGAHLHTVGFPARWNNGLGWWSYSHRHVAPVLLDGRVFRIGGALVSGTSRLRAGERLRVGERLLSPDLRWVLGFDDQGAVSLRPESNNYVHWTTGTPTAAPGWLELLDNGIVQVCDRGGAVIWSSAKRAPASERLRTDALVLENGAGLKVLAHEGSALWTPPRQWLADGHELPKGTPLESRDGRFVAEISESGKVQIRRVVDGAILWSFDPRLGPDVKLRLDENGFRALQVPFLGQIRICDPRPRRPAACWVELSNDGKLQYFDRSFGENLLIWQSH